MQAQAGECNDVKGIAMRIGFVRFGEMNDVGRIRNQWRNGNHNLGGIIFYYQMGSKNGTIEAYEKITGNKVKDDIDEFFQKEAAEKENKETQ